MSYKAHPNDLNPDVGIELQHPVVLESNLNLRRLSPSISYPSSITPNQGMSQSETKKIHLISHPSRLERRRRGVENLKKNFFLCKDASASPVHQHSNSFELYEGGAFNHYKHKSPNLIPNVLLDANDPFNNDLSRESLNSRLGPSNDCLHQRCSTDAQTFSQIYPNPKLLIPFLNFNNNNSNVDDERDILTRPSMQPVNPSLNVPNSDNPNTTIAINSRVSLPNTNPHIAQSHMLPNSSTNGLVATTDSNSYMSPDVPLMRSNNSTATQSLLNNKTKRPLSKSRGSGSLKGDNISFTMISRPTNYYGTKHKRRPLYLCFLASLLLLFAAAIAALTYALIYKSKYTHALKKLEHSEKTCYTPECISIAAMLLEGIDKKADPCNDFYQFACGTWNKLHTIPEDRSSISTFEVLSSKLQIALKSLLEEDEEIGDLMAINQAKALYKSCANNTEAEIVGDAPLLSSLQDLGGWPILDTAWDQSNFSMEIMMARLFMYNTPAFLEILVGPDDKNSSINILQMDQNSLVLPSREYYLNPNNNLILKAYKRLVYTIALLMGATGPQVKAEAEEIVNLEVDIALASVPSADRHDASAIYQKLSFRRLSKIVPQFDWMKFIRHIPNSFVINDTEPIVIYSEPFIRMLGQIVKVTPPRKLANYALWRHVNAFLPHLPQRYADALFAFRKVIYGVSAPIIKWQQCVEYVADHMGMPVGAMFVREHFRNGSKETALEMIHDIRSAFNELLHTNKWMDNETRKVAEEKANAMNELIGYPESIFDEDELNKEYPEVNTTTNFLTNVISIGIHEFSKNFADLRKPVNKDGWGTGPAVVNAFYSPNKNNIVIPAGILQPLFYSETFPKSLNFGGIGVVIGHEITHGFDEKGRQFDKDGNLKQWWNNATIRAFRGRAQCIIDQYSSYKLKEIDMNINGRNTQGENIADNGGLKQAFRAYKKWVEKHGPEQLLPGINLTHEQLFFLNYAQIWCGSMRPEEAVNKIHSSVHSPGPIRVLGPLSNSYDFANAYNCPAGSPMNPTHKCSVW